MNPMYSGHYTFEQSANPCPPEGEQSWKTVKVGFPIRKYADQWVLAPPRILSQLATSFIASLRQGIRQKPFNA